MGKVTFFIVVLILSIIGVAGYLFYLISEEKKENNSKGVTIKPSKVSKKKGSFIEKINNIERKNVINEKVNDDTTHGIDDLLKPDVAHISEITEDQEIIRSFARRRLDESNVSSDFNADKIFFYNNIFKNPPESVEDFYKELSDATGDSFKKELKYAIINDVKLLRSLSKKEDAKKLLKFFSNNAADISDRYMLSVFKNDNAARRSIASDACARALNEFLDNRNNLSVPAKKIILILSFEMLSSNAATCFDDDERSLLGFIAEII